MFRHIVLFRVFDTVSDDAVSEALEILRTLSSLPGIESWQIELSNDSRKGRVIVEEATFVDRAAFDAFRVHPKHAAAAAEMASISDWWIGDYEIV